MRTVAVIGAGTMGHGIAQVAAMSGLEVRLVDQAADALQRGLSAIRRNLDDGVARGKVDAEAATAAAGRVVGLASIAEAAAGADLVIEAVPEIAALKAKLLAEAEAVAPEGAILASNTSSLSIGGLAAGLQRPGRFLGLHFFNPVHLMPLLEIVHGPATEPAVVEVARALGARLGKEVIVVADRPGFATSRLGVCLGMEAIRMLEEGVASAEDIDKAMVLGYRHPIGPLKLTDLVGLDVRLAIGEYLAEQLGNPAFSPPDLLRAKVAAGEVGKKAGQGFYRW